jgi:hypothetical protein
MNSLFNSSDIEVFSQPGDWNKVESLCDCFFPKLSAMYLKAESLIQQIYGINIGDLYTLGYYPTPVKKRRSGTKYSSSKHYDMASISMKPRWSPGKDFYLPTTTGKPYKIRNASLEFDILPNVLKVGFMPVYGKTVQSFRNKFSQAVFDAGLEQVWVFLQENKIFGYPWIHCDSGADNNDKISLSDALRKYDPCVNLQAYKYVGENHVEERPDLLLNEDLAYLILGYVSLFPLLEIYRILTENPPDKTLDEIEFDDFGAKLFAWLRTNLDLYLENFSIDSLDSFTWKSEEQTRQIFQDLLKKDFKKSRPKWLRKTPKSKSLELDGYCESLQLAFEYQGEYHYKEIKIHHRNRTLEEVQENDKLKASICKRKGVDLIAVPYYQKGNVNFIIDELIKLNRSDINMLLE